MCIGRRPASQETCLPQSSFVRPGCAARSGFPEWRHRGAPKARVLRRSAVSVFARRCVVVADKENPMRRLLSLIIFLLPGFAIADDAAPAPAPDAAEAPRGIERIVVSATRTPQLLTKVGASIT